MTGSSPPLILHPDRLLPADPTTRQVARSLYSAVANRPIFFPHGHVDAGVLARDVPFGDPSILLISPDHWKRQNSESVAIKRRRRWRGKSRVLASHLS